MATDWMRVYNDICTEIEILELRAKDLERQMKIARNICFSGKMPSDPSTPCYLPLDKALENHDAIKDKLLTITEELDAKRELRRNIDKHMSRFQGLHYRVAYKRDVEKKSLMSIADELGYAYGYIRRISAQVNRLGGEKVTFKSHVS